MCFPYSAICRALWLAFGAAVFLNVRAVSAARVQVSSLHTSGLGFDQASRIAARLRGGKVNLTKEEEAESPCTKAARGINVSNPPTKRIRQAGLLHFNKEARIDQSKSIGFDACATQVFRDVNVIKDLPKLFPDAMALQFLPGTYVANFTFQTSLYEKGHTYCAAPIALDEEGWNHTHGFRYWAIGKDCCEKIGDTIQFTCGNLSVNVFPPPPPNISLNESIAAAMAGKNITANASAYIQPPPEPQWAVYGIIPTNPMLVDRFSDVVGMAENLHELKMISELGVKVVYVTDDLHAPQPDWLHLPGLKPPICHTPNICVAPIIGGPLPPPPPPPCAGAPGAAPAAAPCAAPGAAPSAAPLAAPAPAPVALDPWDANPPGPLYYAVGRGCCSADRLDPGFGCSPSPLARSGVVLTDKDLRFEWLQGLKKAEAVFDLNSNASQVIFVWWDTASTATWECHKAYYPWLPDQKPEYEPPPKYMGCQTNTGLDCHTDNDCKCAACAKDLICHGALRKCVCSKKCWAPQFGECRGWRKGYENFTEAETKSSLPPPIPPNVVAPLPDLLKKQGIGKKKTKGDQTCDCPPCPLPSTAKAAHVTALITKTLHKARPGKMAKDGKCHCGGCQMARSRWRR